MAQLLTLFDIINTDTKYINNKIKLKNNLSENYQEKTVLVKCPAEGGPHKLAKKLTHNAKIAGLVI